MTLHYTPLHYNYNYTTTLDNSLLHAAKAKEHAIVDSNVSLILPVAEVILWKPLPTFLCEAKDAGWSLTAGFHQASESSI